jgi:hypothetical protein
MIDLTEIPTSELKKEIAKRQGAKSVWYEITGEWSGYRSSQSRIVHREYTKNKAFAEKVRELRSIRYTDGTFLDLDVRQMEYRERKQKEIPGYTSLIRDCIAKGVNSVEELQIKKRARS